MGSEGKRCGACGTSSVVGESHGYPCGESSSHSAGCREWRFHGSRDGKDTSHTPYSCESHADSLSTIKSKCFPPACCFGKRPTPFSYSSCYSVASCALSLAAIISAYKAPEWANKSTHFSSLDLPLMSGGSSLKNKGCPGLIGQNEVRSPRGSEDHFLNEGARRLGP